MRWQTASVAAMLVWGVYSIFGAKAGEIHGEKVSLVFETAAFILLAIAVSSSSLGDFQKVTAKSFAYASIMGLLSAIGFYLILYALRVAPDKIAVIMIVSGAYPVVTAVITNFVGTLLSIGQWAGTALILAGLVLVNWK